MIEDDIWHAYVIWQYRLWSFQDRDTKLERFLANCIQMKLPNFENLSNGELSKIGHHFSNKRL